MILATDQGAVVSVDGGEDVELAGTTSRPRSSTTSRPTIASPTGSTARSRTPAPRRPPRAPTIRAFSCATGARSPPAERTATSRPTPPTRTSSTAAESAASTGRLSRSRTSTRRSPTRATTGASGRCRSRSPRATAAHVLRAPVSLPHDRRRPALGEGEPRPDARGPARPRDPRPRHREGHADAPGRAAASSTRSPPRP